MSRSKDEIVNKAIEFTRRYRPITLDRRDNLIEHPSSWSDVKSQDYATLIELCWAIQNYIYGENNNGKQK